MTTAGTHHSKALIRAYSVADAPRDVTKPRWDLTASHTADGNATCRPYSCFHSMMKASHCTGNIWWEISSEIYYSRRAAFDHITPDELDMDRLNRIFGVIRSKNLNKLNLEYESLSTTNK